MIKLCCFIKLLFLICDKYVFVSIRPNSGAIFIESNPIPIKWAMAKMGLIQNELRLPLTSFSAAYQHALTEVLRSLELV